MTRGECEAFNAGVRSVLAAAYKAAGAIEATPNYKPTRAGFATAALRELAAAGEELLVSQVAQQDDQSTEPAP